MKGDANMNCVFCHTPIKGKKENSYHVYDGGTERQYTGFSIHEKCLHTESELKQAQSKLYSASARAIVAYNLLVEGKGDE
jgi:hypothetical protein